MPKKFGFVVFLDKKITLVASNASESWTESPKLRAVQASVVPLLALVQIIHACTPVPTVAVIPPAGQPESPFGQLTPLLATLGAPLLCI